MNHASTANIEEVMKFYKQPLILTRTAADDLIVNLISKGLSHTALCQLDKHSDEHALQQVSSSVIDDCSRTENILRNDVPKLIRLWFATDHDQIIMSPLFITIRIYHSLEALIRFHQIWNKVSKAFGIVS